MEVTPLLDPQIAEVLAAGPLLDPLDRDARGVAGGDGADG
jgi:hypothetical protein